MSSTNAHWKFFFLFRPNDRRGCSKNMYQMKIRPDLGWIITWQPVYNLREKERFFFFSIFWREISFIYSKHQTGTELPLPKLLDVTIIAEEEDFSSLLLLTLLFFLLWFDIGIGLVGFRWRFFSMAACNSLTRDLNTCDRWNR